MARLLVKKQQKQFIPELEREIVVGKSARYFVGDSTKPFSTLHGTIQPSELERPDGSEIHTDNGKLFTIFSPSFIDIFKRIKRLPQVIPLKDIGFILAECGVGPETTAVDSGTGSGALACMLARVCKKVTSYDIEDEHIFIAQQNKQRLGLDNLSIKKGDFTKGVEERDCNLVTLDLPAPWEGIESAKGSLSIGGFLVSYSPSIPQSIDMANALLAREDFLLIKTAEIMEREWEIDGRKVRPKNKAMIHSGFLTVARRIQ